MNPLKSAFGQDETGAPKKRKKRKPRKEKKENQKNAPQFAVIFNISDSNDSFYFDLQSSIRYNNL